ncbi:hypothetical protein, partial [Deinococcus pimensis]|uniref:hypothetical protein n=1 Tax=Deinococcus pimensis TaxID=309888 RepID=UPI00048572C5
RGDVVRRRLPPHHERSGAHRAIVGPDRHAEHPEAERARLAREREGQELLRRGAAVREEVVQLARPAG